ncbi:MAG: hypothetical protein ACRCZY_12530 [Phocaeicola sp.]
MKKLHDLLSGIGAVGVLSGALLQITQWNYSPYIYLVGAILFAYVQVANGYEGTDLTIRRLRRQQLIGVLLLVVTGVLMLTTSKNEWILCLTVSSILQLYTAFRIPYALRKKDK